MRALKPGGILSVTLWNKEEPPKSVLKLYATMVAAARDVDGGKDIAARSSTSSRPISRPRPCSTSATASRPRRSPSSTPIPRRCRSTRSTIPASRSTRPTCRRSCRTIATSSSSTARRPIRPAPSEKEPNDKPPPGMTPERRRHDGGQGRARRRRRSVPATVLGRLAWHYLINGGWQKVADDYVFDTRILTNHQPYFAAYIKVQRPAEVHRPARTGAGRVGLPAAVGDARHRHRLRASPWCCSR